ncbi:bifunctional glutamate N-acetyltransferase/amino-acid acetyltransferase ArgJ [Brockia lithotrophica]|uniref:Arginine biosynthesis bifunctional protein ArgJ n=1 Tax=Brockia lithotrophica TaxID=933949 RepID=A0A660LA81_9BACL|nr:bifunctional glutamate N-acetyltransferase/amino-acid acetyltransferase ArgJ [Brockia lithotrophica]RKQ88863.1 glutamate N-acetyltransferase [Brockia lithotrophica]
MQESSKVGGPAQPMAEQSDRSSSACGKGEEAWLARLGYPVSGVLERCTRERGVAAPRGFRAGGVHAGIKRRRPDLGWIVSDVPARAAAVYTRHAFPAAPLLVTREAIARSGGVLRAVIVNSGNANAITGERGFADARRMQALFAERIGAPPEHVAVASTGVIGVPLPMERIENALAELPLAEADEGAFARAILTTDTRTKQAAATIVVDGVEVTVAGTAKGSGMIHPNMATMLAFFTTDAEVDRASLEGLFREVSARTFNRISVDGDTSTNDMALILANGLAGNRPLEPSHPDWGRFRSALFYVARELARAIAEDGEGATKLLHVRVDGARDEASAGELARAVVRSSLVKAAVYGADPNWGRIASALGASGIPFSPEGLSVVLQGIPVLARGMPLPFDEAAASARLREEYVLVDVHLEDGSGVAEAWGCDLTEDYVRINAHYRT